MSEVIRISNIEGYIQEITNGALILKPKEIYITETELNMTPITHSKIEKHLAHSI